MLRGPYNQQVKVRSTILASKNNSLLQHNSEKPFQSADRPLLLFVFSRLSIIWIIDKTVASRPRAAAAEWSLSHVPPFIQAQGDPPATGRSTEPAWESQGYLPGFKLYRQPLLPQPAWPALHPPGALPASRIRSFPHPRWWRTDWLTWYWLDWFIGFPESCFVAFEKAWQNLWLLYNMRERLTCFAYNENKVTSEAWFWCVCFPFLLIHWEALVYLLELYFLQS